MRKISPGELVLIVGEHNNPQSWPNIGLFKNFIGDGEKALRIGLTNPRKLKCNSIKNGANNSYSIIPWNGNPSPTFIFGKENIIDYLKQRKDLKIHTKWISDLQIPYKLPTRLSRNYFLEK